MNDLDRILDNQATIMRVLMEILSTLPTTDKTQRIALVRLLGKSAAEAHEYAHRRETHSDAE